MSNFEFPKASSFKQASQPRVALGVLVLGGVAAIPLMFKSVRDRENSIARMRDDSYDQQDTVPPVGKTGDAGAAKDSARNDRLRVMKSMPE